MSKLHEFKRRKTRVVRLVFHFPMQAFWVENRSHINKWTGRQVSTHPGLGKSGFEELGPRTWTRWRNDQSHWRTGRWRNDSLATRPSGSTYLTSPCRGWDFLGEFRCIFRFCRTDHSAAEHPKQCALDYDCALGKARPTPDAELQSPLSNCPEVGRLSSYFIGDHHGDNLELTSSIGRPSADIAPLDIINSGQRVPVFDVGLIWSSE